MGSWREEALCCPAVQAMPSRSSRSPHSFPPPACFSPAQGAEMVRRLLVPTGDECNEHKRKQLMELALLNGKGPYNLGPRVL